MLTISQTLLLAGFIIFSMLGFMLVMWVREMSISYQSIARDLKLIAASKRISVLLELERKEGLTISPEQFEANKPLIQKKMFDELEEQIKRGRVATDGDTAALMISTRSGFSDFVEYQTHKSFREALARLFANNDIDMARQLIKQAIAAL